ncbi:MAG TPA: YraN family protein [Candidatus Paceibacterota bacterium]|nr:YraN family protein [Candidatus Paceibacterota bacterium]
MENRKLGRLGEEIALRYLLKTKHVIIERNFKKKFGEIDIIARSIDGMLIFCEVKTMAFGDSAQMNIFKPSDRINFKKIQHMRRMARFYSLKNSSLVFDIGWRIDAISVFIKSEHKADVVHFKNIA